MASIGVPIRHVPSDFTTPPRRHAAVGVRGPHAIQRLRAGGATRHVRPRAPVLTKLAIAIADMQCQVGSWLGAGPRTRRRAGRSGRPSCSGFDADTLIRERSSNGAKSAGRLRAQVFSTRPLVVPYTLAEVVSTLNETTLPHDWEGFVRERRARRRRSRK
ncbi:hypothetical protein V2A60_002558 [Cordyceps javanica]